MPGQLLVGLVGWTRLPPVISLFFLIRLWWISELFGTQAAIFVGWFVAALLLQGLSRSPAIWGIGVVAQVALAIALILKWRLDQI